MADADEDTIRPTSAHASDAEDDTAPDFSTFRNLLHASGPRSKTKTQHVDNNKRLGASTTTTAAATAISSLPRRGEKDFEPHGTNSQADVLANSRAEMHLALGFVRVHQPAKRVVGVYERRSGLTRVEKVTGKIFQTVGRADRRGLWLWPEEALYLVERGDLDVRWEGSVGDDDDVEDDDGKDTDGEEGIEGGGEGEGDAKGARKQVVTFSLQTAYAVYVGDTARGVSLERYNVYANLKRGGFAVFRGPAWEVEDHDKDEIKPREKPVETKTRNSAWSWLYSLLSSKNYERPLHGPLRGQGPFRSYQDVYKRLEIVSWHDPTLPTARESPNISTDFEDPKDPIRVAYYVYKSREAFKKSNPGPPDFRIAVVDAREEMVPTIEQLDGLLASTPYAPPHPVPENDNAGRMYARLKYGYRNVILAVVDQGLISYLRLADAGFGREKLYAGAGRSKFGNKGGKRGGRGGGRGGRGGRGRGK